MYTRSECTCTCGFPRLNCLGNRDDCVFNEDFGPAPRSPSVYFAQKAIEEAIKVREEDLEKMKQMSEALL